MSETLASVGEFGLIDRIDSILRREGLKTPGTVLGIGDDCASFRPREGFEILVTCDSMVEGRHFLPSRITPLELGRRAMAMNLSDIGAMGGNPLYALVSIGLGEDVPVKDIEEMYRGFLRELNPFGVCIIGGNVTKSGGGLFIDITLIGEVEPGRALSRSGAQVGDVILVTGFPGQSAAGLHLLLNCRTGPDDLRDHELVCAYKVPCHRAREGRAIALLGGVTAMIDISDGLLGDLGHICERSGVGANLIREKLPRSNALIRRAADLDRDPLEWVLSASDDYELLLTCPPGLVERVCSAVAQVSDVNVSEIGTVTGSQGKVRLVSPDGSIEELSTSGWDHFARHNGA
jgi:thiamine-monophosphate kinase